MFRIGHLGDFNDLMLAGTLAGVEMGLAVVGCAVHAAAALSAALWNFSRRSVRARAVAGYDTTPSRRSAAMSSCEKPVSARTSSVCSPRSGARRAAFAGVPLILIGDPSAC